MGKTDRARKQRADRPATRNRLFWATLQVAAALGIYGYVTVAVPRNAGQTAGAPQVDLATSTGSSHRAAGSSKRTARGALAARNVGESPSHGDVSARDVSAKKDEPAAPPSLLTKVEGLMPENQPASPGWLASRIEELSQGFSTLGVRDKVVRAGSGGWDFAKRAASSLRTRVKELWASADKSSQALPEAALAKSTNATPSPGAQAPAIQPPVAPAADVPKSASPARSASPASPSKVGQNFPLGDQKERFF